MKHVIGVGLLLGFVLPMGVVKARAQSKDEEAIRKVFSDFADAWAKDDAKGMASLWAEDGDVINPQGRKATGRADVEKLFADEHATIFKGSHISFKPGTIVFVKPDVAVFTTDYAVPDAHGPDGSAMGTGGIVTCVMVKKSGKWKTFSARPMVPLPPPPGQ